MADGPHAEIIIIKRHGDHEDGHHGGAWKIALADFMTAMMALFLVMWLINSTSKAQKQSIAEYFNPVKLAEVTHDRKGLSDPQDTPSDTGAAGGKAQDGKAQDSRAQDSTAQDGGSEGESATGAGRAAPKGEPGSRARESALFQDPYAVLAKLAGEADREAAASADAAALESGRPGISGGEAARDPFDPLYWQVEALPSRRSDQPGALDTAPRAPSESRLDARGQIVPPASKPRERTRADREAKDAGRAVQVASADAMPLAGLAETAKDPAKETPAEAPKADAAKPEPGKPAEAPKPAPASRPDTRPAEPDMRAAETAAMAEIKAEIAKAVQPGALSAPTPQIEVRRTGEGVLISVTDAINFSMFAVGSAEPSPKVVRALERIAKVLNARPGRIVVRGHTDGRPFRSETYDNWRLSSARAQMASYMLVRGGVDEKRLERIEGYADRLPRNAGDSKAAENRRIEILLRGRSE